MNALELLTKQHETVETLFSQVTHYDKGLEWEITRNITRHADLEETYFYPALLKKEETKDFVEHAQKEHSEVKELLLDWEMQSGEEWMTTANKIMENVRHHVKEEENELFPKVKTVFTEDELVELGTAMTT